MNAHRGASLKEAIEEFFVGAALFLLALVVLRGGARLAGDTGGVRFAVETPFCLINGLVGRAWRTDWRRRRRREGGKASALRPVERWRLGVLVGISEIVLLGALLGLWAAGALEGVGLFAALLVGTLLAHEWAKKMRGLGRTTEPGSRDGLGAGGTERHFLPCAASREAEDGKTLVPPTREA